MPAGLEDVSRYPDLFAELVRRGWSDADLEKLARGNLLRTLRRAEAGRGAAAEASRAASFVAIEQADGGKAAPDTY